VSKFWASVLLAVVLGLVANELCDLAPWLARRLVPKAAKLWAGHDSDRATVLEEEWAAVVEDCPGKLTKLALALRFMAWATCRSEHSRLWRLYRLVRVRFRRAAAMINTFKYEAVGFAGVVFGMGSVVVALRGAPATVWVVLGGMASAVFAVYSSVRAHRLATEYRLAVMRHKRLAILARDSATRAEGPKSTEGGSL
jgi:hypothetical protein